MIILKSSELLWFVCFCATTDRQTPSKLKLTLLNSFYTNSLKYNFTQLNYSTMASKPLKPGEAQKFLTLMIDERIPNFDEVEAFLVGNEIKYERVKNPILLNSITFKRELAYEALDHNLKPQKISKFEDEDQVFVILKPDDIVPKLYLHIHQNEPLGIDGDYNDEIDVITYGTSLQQTSNEKHVTFIIIGMDKYFKKVKKDTQQEFRDRVLNNDQQQPKPKRRKKQLPTISSIEFQSCMVELQLQTNITYRLVNSVEQLGKMLMQYTKAIADAPFKRQRKEQGFDYLTTADTAGSVKVEKDGKGLKTLWIEQLRLFGSLGLDAAQAIARVYPSPAELIKKYDECLTTEEGLDLLKDIDVRKGVGALANHRKLGPELSRKIYRFFNSLNPERCLGSSQNV